MEESRVKRPERHYARVEIKGRIHEPAILKPDGKAWFVVWINPERPAKNGDTVPDKTQYMRCQRWNAQNWAQWATKGRHVLIEGRLEGYYDTNNRVQMFVNIDKVDFLDTPSTDNGHAELSSDVSQELEALQTYNARLEESGLRQQQQYMALHQEHGKLRSELETAQRELERLKAEALKQSPVLAQKRAPAPSAGKVRAKRA
jgi:single-stranded DNA-binding protein